MTAAPMRPRRSLKALPVPLQPCSCFDCRTVGGRERRYAMACNRQPDTSNYSPMRTEPLPFRNSPGSKKPWERERMWRSDHGRLPRAYRTLPSERASIEACSGSSLMPPYNRSGSGGSPTLSADSSCFAEWSRKTSSDILRSTGSGSILSCSTSPNGGVI